MNNAETEARRAIHAWPLVETPALASRHIPDVWSANRNPFHRSRGPLAAILPLFRQFADSYLCQTTKLCLSNHEFPIDVKVPEMPGGRLMRLEHFLQRQRRSRFQVQAEVFGRSISSQYSRTI
jgi:hypothetical protein